MARRASEGIDDLADRTSGPDVRATVTVDQPYAQDQHETLYYRHASGGRAKYLEAPMMENHQSWIRSFADALLDPQRRADRGWGGVGQKLRGVVKTNAPIDFGDLKQSAGLVVKAGSRLVMNLPPEQGRLSEQELDAKDYMRNAGQGYRE